MLEKSWNLHQLDFMFFQSNTLSGNNVHYLCTVGLENSLKYGSENSESFTGLKSHSEISVAVAFL